MDWERPNSDKLLAMSNGVVYFYSRCIDNDNCKYTHINRIDNDFNGNNNSNHNNHYIAYNNADNNNYNNNFAVNYNTDNYFTVNYNCCPSAR